MNKTTIQFTPYGPIVIIWRISERGAKIVRVLLSNPAESATDKVSALYSEVDESYCDEIDSVSSAICRFLEGTPISFGLDVVDLIECGVFQRRVLVAEHAIPRGCVSTYKLISAHLGVPGRARALGNALANNPFPLIVPCHRVIRSDCSLGGFQGGLDMKRSLLRKEGIAFDHTGRVRCSQFHYD